MNSTNIEIEITFGEAKDDSSAITLTWELTENLFSFYWLKYLASALSNKLVFKPRFMGFIDGSRNQIYLTSKINECIDIINKDNRWRHLEKLTQDFSQNFSNYIHHEFELLIGNEWEKTELWKTSSKQVKSAIVGLNDYTHELEAWQRSTRGREQDCNFTMAYVLTEFFRAPSMDIKDRFQDDFSLNTEFGDISLHYSQIGKTWLEVCLDKDTDIFSAAIQPLWKLTGSFNIMFHEVDEKGLREQVFSHLKTLGIDPLDKSLRLGLLTVAKLKTDQYQPKEIIQFLSETQDISKIQIIQNKTRIIAENTFGSRIERYFL